MKQITLYKRLPIVFLLGIIISMGFFSCTEEYPNAFRHTDGVPEVLFVRMTSPASADSLLDGAFMGSTICLVGNNLRSIHQLFFNDQQALLNSSYITDHTLLVTVPNRIPVDVSDKIFMVTYANDTVAYDFKTRVPGPSVNSMSCEYAPEGTEATLYGDYFIDDPNIPLRIEFAGNLPVTQIISIEKTQVTFVVPKGAMKGYINVTTLYGTGRSRFQYRDDRGMILDWDNLNANGGWRPGRLSDVDGISGKYVEFNGVADIGTAWNSEDDLSFNLWGKANGRPEGDFFDATNLSNLQMKFEVNVLTPWTAAGMQMVFTPWATTGTNGYYSDGTVPRGIWIPWAAAPDRSFQTNGWITVTIPMTSFNTDRMGKVIGLAKAGNFGGLSFFVYAGGIDGVKGPVHMRIDNIRVVPVDK